MKLNKIVSGILLGSAIMSKTTSCNQGEEYAKYEIGEIDSKESIVEVSVPDIVIRPGEYDGKPGKRVYINPNTVKVPSDIPIKVDNKGYYIQEFDINLKLCKAITRKLEAKGVKVEFQVAENKYQDLNAAGRRAAKTGAPIYLSVHHNYYNETSSGYFFMTNEGNVKDAKYAERLSNSIKDGNIKQMKNRINDGYIGEMNETGGMINILGEFGFFSNIEELQKIMSNERIDYVSTQIAHELYDIIIETN